MAERKRKMMTKEEAKDMIKAEFMKRYAEWFSDRTGLDDMAYGRKYGWGKSERLMNLKDNLTAVVFFQKYIFSGLTQERWEAVGIDRKAVWGLSADGWLNRCDGHYKRPTYYCLTQQRAKEIWKESRSK